MLGVAALAAATLLALDRAVPPDLSRYRAQSLEIEDRSGETLHIATTQDGMWRLASTPDEVSPHYLDLLLATEDHRFWRHPGVDPLALARAAWQLARSGHVVSGGSTLTMQVARLLAPHRHDVAGKLLDIVRALQLEAHYSKREILAMYLTLAPFGGNIEGVRAASLAYFAHEPARLTDGEAALLVALPQRPTTLRPDRHPERAAHAEQRIMARHNLEPSAEPAPERHALAALAPHLAQRLASAGAVGRVRTTLDAGVQRALEELARREQPWLGGAADLAVLVVRNADRSVLGYLGGVDYFAAGGMVDMVRARRSPGSSLKPFIYGLAFDDGLIRADTLIEDVPLRIGDYAPRNFDRVFHGTVTAREALQQSYNLPAVALLQGVGPRRFAAALRQAGARIALPRGTAAPGLPIALGGLGISLEDLAALYVALADRGAAAKLRFLEAAPAPRGVPLMTEEAAAEIGEVLRGVPPPDGIAPARPRGIAYKTGTSYGFRDAWAIGFSPEFTVAVWVGRVEGSPRPGAVGRNTAAPLLFKTFDLLPVEPDWTSPPHRFAASRSRLAPALRRFAGSPSTLEIVFPPPGARLDAAPGDTPAPPIALEAAGGVPPYRWAVNGMPLPPPPIGQTLSWHPDGPGFARIAVTDRNEHTVSEEIRLQ